MGPRQTYPQNRGVYTGGSFARCSDMRHGVDSARSFTCVHTCLSEYSCVLLLNSAWRAIIELQTWVSQQVGETIRNACGTSSGASRNHKP